MRCKQSEKDALFRAPLFRAQRCTTLCTYVCKPSMSLVDATLGYYIARSSLGRNVVELNDLVQEFYHYHRAIRSSSATFSTVTRYA